MGCSTRDSRPCEAPVGAATVACAVESMAAVFDGAFRGLVAGSLVSWLMERPDFGTLGKG